MLTYPALCPVPVIFPALTGLTRAEFDRLVGDFTTARDRLRATSNRTKRGTPRRRAAGAGAPPARDPPSRLLITLVWLRIYPTYELLGRLFGLRKSNAWEAVQDALAVLETLADFPFGWPAAGRKKRATKQAVLDAFPQVAVIIDAEEQPFRRPRGRGRQKPFYSGKKRRHTVKNQIACRPDGRIAAVSRTVPGSTHDLTLL